MASDIMSISFHDPSRADKNKYQGRLKQISVLPKTEVGCLICGSDKPTLIGEKDGLKVVACANCGHIYVNPRFTEAAIKEIYDLSYWTEFQPSIGSPSIMERTKFDYLNAQAKLNRDILPHIQSGFFLDIGCSNGALVKRANENGFTAIGLEVDEEVAKFGRQVFGVQIKSGTLKENNFPPAFFDIITLYDVLEHLFNPHEELTEIQRILKPRSILVIETLNTDSLTFHQDPLLWPYFSPIEHVHYYNQRNLVTLLIQHGLKLLECRCPHENNIVICCQKCE